MGTKPHQDLPSAFGGWTGGRESDDQEAQRTVDRGLAQARQSKPVQSEMEMTGKPEEQERQEIANKEMRDRRADEPWQAEMERAEKFANGMAFTVDDSNVSGALDGPSRKRFIEKIARALAEVRAKERERCAKWLEEQAKQYIGGGTSAALYMKAAAAIRRGGA